MYKVGDKIKYNTMPGEIARIEDIKDSTIKHIFFTLENVYNRPDWFFGLYDCYTDDTSLEAVFD